MNNNLSWAKTLISSLYITGLPTDNSKNSPGNITWYLIKENLLDLSTIQQVFKEINFAKLIPLKDLKPTDELSLALKIVKQIKSIVGIYCNGSLDDNLNKIIKILGKNNTTFKPHILETALFIFQLSQETSEIKKKMEEENLLVPPDAFFTKDELFVIPKKSALSLNYSNQKHYLHANKVVSQDKHNYVAMKFPAKNRDFFWKNMFEHNCFGIVDLTEPSEHKFTPYHPITVNQELKLPNILIKCNGIQNITKVPGLKKYNLTLTDKTTGRQKDIVKFHFTEWKDCTSLSPSSILNLVKYLNTEFKKSNWKTPFIHCAAGVGRTGTVITAWTLLHLKEQNLLNEANYETTLKKIILSGRMQRCDHFVHSYKQVPELLKMKNLLT